MRPFKGSDHPKFSSFVTKVHYCKLCGKRIPFLAITGTMWCATCKKIPEGRRRKMVRDKIEGHPVDL